MRGKLQVIYFQNTQTADKQKHKQTKKAEWAKAELENSL